MAEQDHVWSLEDINSCLAVLTTAEHSESTPTSEEDHSVVALSLVEISDSNSIVPKTISTDGHSEVMVPSQLPQPSQVRDLFPWRPSCGQYNQLSQRKWHFFYFIFMPYALRNSLLPCSQSRGCHPHNIWHHRCLVKWYPSLSGTWLDHREDVQNDVGLDGCWSCNIGLRSNWKKACDRYSLVNVFLPAMVAKRSWADTGPLPVLDWL